MERKKSKDEFAVAKGLEGVFTEALGPWYQRQESQEMFEFQWGRGAHSGPGPAGF